MSSLYRFTRPFLFSMDPETAHNMALAALKASLIPPLKTLASPRLETVLWDRKFPNPVGLAAGFDKNAVAIGPLLRMGFGFVEAGTVTPKPQTGNPKPRVFRDADSRSVINAMGFPNEGLSKFRSNIEKFLEHRPRPAGLIGINIGMNKEQKVPERDYCLLLRELGALADYITVNISSPNTPGLRDLQSKESLHRLLKEILAEREKSCRSAPPPLLVKLAPDMDESQQEETAAILMESGIDGLVLTNTTISRPSDLPAGFSARKGGLSGKKLTGLSTSVIHNFYRFTDGKLPLIGVGGVSTAGDAWEKIRAGASLIQLYTALAFEGPCVVNDINTGLLKHLDQAGLSHIGEAVGMAHGRNSGAGESGARKNDKPRRDDKKSSKKS